MDIEADVIEFKVPTENNKTLFIWDILPTLPEAFIYESICGIFSGFGALYLVKVCPNAAVAEPGFYAIVKYYSSAQASKAQRATDGKSLFQESPLKVRLCTRQNPAFSSEVRPLSNSKCQELANRYLGFNGWSSRIITLQDLSGGDDGCSDTETQALALKFGCIVELAFPPHRSTCRGVGVAGESFQNLPDHLEVCLKRGKLKKWAKDKAMVDAFRNVLLVLLSNGKVAVECRFDPDQVLPDEDLKGLLKVNDVTWSGCEGAGEDDLLSELSLDVSCLS
ncbi:RAD52 motif-containing protein 1 isoform X2 [Conger conger]|uniref:RAD52 motif-containing protein 1 isoform X2 n=1 Tax=Conger conger TaxID=82655 RepID=UPI002A5A84D6|nr:RAD52 motif-containing protein 1 isoform X2 [Conger conger]